MNEQLLVECIPFIPEEDLSLIKESATPGSKLIVSGTLQRADQLNQNLRIYPKNILEREAKVYMTDFINPRRALGELDHPDSSVVNLQNASHLVIDMWWEGSDLKGKVEILDTPAGNILKKLFAAKVTLGISSRGLGSVREVHSESAKNAKQVQDDFKLIAFDFVSDPSTHNAFLSPMNESKDYSQSKNFKHIASKKKIDSLISQIFCDVKGKCSF